jgi:anti-anti-sigma factor
MDLVTSSQECGRVPVTILHVNDRLNMGNTAQLEEAARQAGETGSRHMVIDLSNAPSLTSAGIRSLVIIYKQVTPHDNASQHLALVCPGEAVREVLRISGLLEYIPVFDDVKSAVASLG